MRILIAEDDPIARRVLEATLAKWGYAVVAACDGTEAWQILQTDDAPNLVILDWMMPGMDGIEVCRKVRDVPDRPPTYMILLTAMGGTEDLVAGLEAGADDYVTKPFNCEELHARVKVGARVIELQQSLADHVRELRQALASVKQLRGLLPICSYCKKIRTDGNYWQQVESYVAEHSEAQFSHSICPACYDSEVAPLLKP